MSIQGRLGLAVASFTAGFYTHTLIDKKKDGDVLEAKNLILKADQARQAALQHPERIPEAIKSATKSLISEHKDKN